MRHLWSLRGDVHSPTPTLGFAIKFGVCFAVLMGAFEISRGTVFERVLVEDMILKPTVALTQLIAPSTHVELTGRTIVAAETRLHVTRGCEGIEIFLILAAAVLAFPARLRQRLQGMLIGSALAYALSIGRLCALIFILHNSPAAWDALHGLVLPLAPLIFISLFFLHWTRQADASIASQSRHAA